MPSKTGFQTHPISTPPNSTIDFGIEVTGLDLQTISDSDFSLLHRTLYENQVVLIRNQHHLTPAAQYALTRRFDPLANTYSHGKAGNADTRSVLHKDLKTIPSVPQVQVIGHGYLEEYEGLRDVHLQHPHHKNFHATRVPEENDKTHTRFYRWHIDSAMYALHPPKVTSLFAVEVPGKGRRQTLVYDDGSGREMDVSLGTTAFFSGYRLYDLLADDEKEWVRGAKVEYAPHPYIWMSKCRARSNGLGLLSEGLELPVEELPEVEESKVKTYPMVWVNPVTGRLAMMVYPTAARKIHLADGTVIEELEEVRECLYKLQRRAIEPELVYAHEWQEGDVVLFNNWGVMHSIVGAFGEGERRVFRQCNMAASEGPSGP